MGEFYDCELTITGHDRCVKAFKRANRGTPVTKWDKEAQKDVLDFDVLLPPERGCQGCRYLRYAEIMSEGGGFVQYGYQLKSGHGIGWLAKVSSIFACLKFVMITTTGQGEDFSCRYVAEMGRVTEEEYCEHMGESSGVCEECRKVRAKRRPHWRRC